MLRWERPTETPRSEYLAPKRKLEKVLSVIGPVLCAVYAIGRCISNYGHLAGHRNPLSVNIFVIVYRVISSLMIGIGGGSLLHCIVLAEHGGTTGTRRSFSEQCDFGGDDPYGLFQRFCQDRSSFRRDSRFR